MFHSKYKLKIFIQQNQNTSKQGMASSAVNEGEVEIQCPEVSSTLPIILRNPNNNPVIRLPPSEPPTQDSLQRNAFRRNRNVYPRPYPVITRPVLERLGNIYFLVFRYKILDVYFIFMWINL